MATSVDLTQNASFMDLYSRQIGAFGLETMSKLIHMKVLLVGLGGVGIEAAKNLVLAGPGTVTLCDDTPTSLADLGVNFYVAEEDTGKPRASVCAPRLQELNGLVRVQVHNGGLTEEAVAAHDMLVITTANLGRDELVRWNAFCREHKTQVSGQRAAVSQPIRFICAASMGALSYVFSDFGDNFLVNDETGEPCVSRTVTHITCEENGIVQLVDPHTSELAQPHNIEESAHRGFVTLSEVEGMYCRDETQIPKLGHSINSAPPFKIQHVWKTVPEQLLVPRSLGGDGKQREEQYWVRVVDPATGDFRKDADQEDGLARVPKFARETGDLPEEHFVRLPSGEKARRMTRVKDLFQLRVGDTTGYSAYEGGGLLQQVLEPAIHHHASLSQRLQQPLGQGTTALASCDGDKAAAGYWYPLLHVVKQALLAFQASHDRLPIPNDPEEAEEVVRLTQDYNAAMRQTDSFCGPDAALAVPLDLSGAASPPPDVTALDAEQQRLVADLQASLGLDAVSACLQLQEHAFDVEAATMAMFTDPEASAKLATKKAAVDTFQALDAIRAFARAAGAEFQPLSCFIGGVVAQEVVKFTGKFTPLNQWLHFDCVEVLPETPPPAGELAANRYAHNLALFGPETQRRLGAAKTFMVGCGALGCEFLKNFALLGVGSEGGKITVTDGDRIEVSNLNRQFLFREEHVGRPKSTTAAAAALRMNASMQIESLELLAMPSTEDTFNDDFWSELTFVTNALDSVKARKYVDRRCVFYAVPLLESGTEGTKFNSMVVLPGRTESYDEGDPEPPAGEAIPMCTLRNFPSTMVHCIEWARGQFEDFFVTPIVGLRDFFEDPVTYVASLRAEAEAYMMDANTLAKAIDTISPAAGGGLLGAVRELAEVQRGGFSACARLAADHFCRLYEHRMRDLMHQFPRDYEAGGKPFWAPPKRFPTVLEWNGIDDTMMSFVLAAANLYAVAYGLQPLPENGRKDDGSVFDTFVAPGHEWRDPRVIHRALEGWEPPAWSPSGEKIATEEGEEAPAPAAESVEDMVAKLGQLLTELSSAASSVTEAKPQPADFEKDLDPNFHIDFVAAAANLRARNYAIKETTRHKVKMIAGKIIPAIATSTACATALVCMEVLKLLQDKPKVHFRNSSSSFAINAFHLAEPAPPRTVSGRHTEFDTPDPISEPDAFDAQGNVLEDRIRKRVWVAVPDPHTKWDRVRVPPGTTLNGLLNMLEQQNGIIVSGWTADVAEEDGGGGVVLYSKPRDAAKLGFDQALLEATAPLDLPFQKAQMAVLRCKEIRNKQLYTMQWKALQPETQEKQAAFRQRTLARILEEKAGGVGGRRAVELALNLENADGEEVRAPPVILEL